MFRCRLKFLTVGLVCVLLVGNLLQLLHDATQLQCSQAVTDQRLRASDHLETMRCETRNVDGASTQCIVTDNVSAMQRAPLQAALNVPLSIRHPYSALIVFAASLDFEPQLLLITKRQNRGSRQSNVDP